MTSITTPLLAIALIGAVDMSKIYAARLDAQRAMDAAVLSLTRSEAEGGDLEAAGDRMFRMNIEQKARILSSSFSGENGEIVGEALVEVDTFIIQPMDVAVSATAYVSGTAPVIEVAIVFDSSGSMGYDEQGYSPWWSHRPSRLENARDAALQFVRELKAGVSDPTKVYISVAAYSDTVGIDSSLYSSLLAATSIDGNPTPWAAPPLRIGAAERFGLADHDDTPPEDEPVAFFREFSYWVPGRGRGRGRGWGWGSGGRWVSNGRATPPNAALPLTNDLSTVEQYLEGLSPDGWTAGHLGFEWGWFTISPRWRNFWDLPSGAPFEYGESLKAIFIFSDGEFNHSPRSNFSALQGGDVNDYFLETCANARDAGIHVFAASYIDGDSATLQSCADDEDRFFNAQNAAQLMAAFRASGEGVLAEVQTKVRLSR